MAYLEMVWGVGFPPIFTSKIFFFSNFQNFIILIELDIEQKELDMG